MVGGFNTNVRYRSRNLHVQTEDSGTAHPVVHTLLYEGGAILYSHKVDYSDRLEADDLEEVVREIMGSQHRQVLQDLRDGELDSDLGLGTDEAPPRKSLPARFGEGVITDRPLSELILDFFSNP